MTDHTGEWRELPLRGEIAELVILGSGKDCALQVRIPDGRALAIPLSRARATIKGCDGVVMTTLAADDVNLSMAYRPLPGWRMQIARAEVRYPGSEDDWAADCEVWQRMSRAPRPRESSWAVDDISLELAAIAET